MKFKNIVSIIPVVLFLAGCASSSFHYTPPATMTNKSTKHVEKSFDVTWNQLVKELSSDFFVINNIDKNSRLINISFSSQKPSEYIDCGQTSRTFTNARGTNTYTYKTADSSTFSTTNPSGDAFNVDRKTKLEGRSNVYIAPDGNGTEINVNTKFVLTIITNAYTFDGRGAGAQNSTVDFSTKHEGGGNDIRCISNGVIEHRILDMVGN